MENKRVKNVIVVDDDRTIRVVISTALSRAGYNVKSSGTAAGMWRLVESDFADVLITDVGLPDGDALDILPKLQKKMRWIYLCHGFTITTTQEVVLRLLFVYIMKRFFVFRNF